MNLFTDILKGLPENAVLRSKIADAEKRYAALETENAILKDDLRDAKAEIAKLKKQIEELTHTDDLDDVDKTILSILSACKYNKPWAEFFADEMNMHIEEIKHRLNKLEKAKYITSMDYGEGYWQYSFRDKGREYVIRNKLLATPNE